MACSTPQATSSPPLIQDVRGLPSIFRTHTAISHPQWLTCWRPTRSNAISVKTGRKAPISYARTYSSVLSFRPCGKHIKPKTTYRVEFETDELVTRAVAALHRMDKIEPAKIHMSAGQLGVTRGGITATAVSVADEEVSFGMRPIPD